MFKKLMEYLNPDDAFEEGFDYLLVDEGGYSNASNDRGGATRWGITRSEASKWLRRPVSVGEMKSLPIDTAKEIYRAWYWKAMACDKMEHENMAIAIFDLGVVRGVTLAPRYAQEICNDHGSTLVLDGHVGPKTLAALNEIDPALFVRAFSLRAEAGFRAIVERNPSQIVFLKGWVARARRLITLAGPFNSSAAL
jgi:lysozyme family protein